MQLNACRSASETCRQRIPANLIAMAVVYCLLLGGMTSGWAFASADHRRERMTFELKDVTTPEVLSEASRLSGSEIAVNGRVYENRLTLNFVDASPEDLLRRVLNGLNYSVIWDGSRKRVVVSVVDQGMDDDRETSSLRSNPPSETIHQHEVITERVMRESGEQAIVRTIHETPSRNENEPSYRMTWETNSKTQP